MISQSMIVRDHSTKGDGFLMVRASYNWTPEDRLTQARWMRAIGVFYGCISLVFFGFLLVSERLVEHRVEQAMGWDVCIPVTYGISDRNCDGSGKRKASHTRPTIGE